MRSVQVYVSDLKVWKSKLHMAFVLAYSKRDSRICSLLLEVMKDIDVYLGRVEE